MEDHTDAHGSEELKPCHKIRRNVKIMLYKMYAYDYQIDFTRPRNIK